MAFLGLIEPGPGEQKCESGVGFVGDGFLAQVASGLSIDGHAASQYLPRAVVDNSLFMEVGTGCSGPNLATVLYSVPLAGGDPLELVPAPTSIDPTAPEGEYPTVWQVGLTGWVVKQ